MDGNRIEIVPPCLLALAAGAFGLSITAMALHDGGRRADGARPSPVAERPPIVWPSDESPSLGRVDLEALGVPGGERSARFTFRVAPPELSDPRPVESRVAIDALAAAPFARVARTPIAAAVADDPAPSFVVLLPAAPRLSAASGPVREVGAWEVFGVDAARLPREVGVALGAASTIAERTRLDAARLATARVARVRFRRTPKVEATPVRAVIAPAATPEEDRPQRAERRRVDRSVTQRPAIPAVTRYLEAGVEAGLFPTPVELGHQLARLTDTQATVGWAWAVAYRVRGVVGSPAADEAAVRRSLSALRRCGAEAERLADDAADPQVAAELRRAKHALARRAATWSAVLSDPVAMGGGVADEQRVADWLLGARWAMAPEHFRPGYTLSRPSATVRLARRLEDYEAGPSGAAARAIVGEAVRLARSGDAAGVRLAGSIQEHYRNANVRVAVAGELLERLLPEEETIVAPVRDRIAGAPVRGRSTTRRELSLAMVPDAAAWRLRLQADGEVRSDTVSRGGPAALRSRGATSFRAQKLIVVGPRGVAVAPSAVDATASASRLVAVSTRYDRVPVLGSYVRSAARREYDQSRRRARVELQAKVERRVGEALDDRADAAIARLRTRYREDVLGRLANLDLRVEPVEMRTTEKRVIGRLRVAGDRQLAAHTPRMRAPSDSLLSVQLHESTLNNALEGLGVAGERMRVAELRDRLASRLGLRVESEADAEEALVRFAAEDPVRIRFEDGHARLTLAFDELIVRGRRHRDFRVHTLYRPAAEGLRAYLVQTAPPQIEGRMRSSTRLRLHAAVGKMLGEDRRIPLTPGLDRLRPQIARRLDDLQTTQLVVEDGWLGMAFAPRRPDARLAVRVGTYVR